MKRVNCLYRVSTKSQVDKDDIPMQKIECRNFAERQGWTIVKEFSEKGVSGFKVSANDRDVIQDLKAAALNKEFDILLVFMFDRIGRIDDETPFIVEWFTKQGIEVWSVQEGEQRFENHVDKLMNYIRFWQASGESIKTSTRIKTRLSQMTAEGKYTGGQTPFGYRTIKTGQFNKKGKELLEIEIDDMESELVKMIFEKTVRDGYGSWRLADLLNQQGIKTHNGSKFQCNTILRILKNQMYCGYFISGDTKSPFIERIHIIDENVFCAAQKILNQRSAKDEEKQQIALNTKGNTLLSGNIYCGHCGKNLTTTTYTDRYERADGSMYCVKKQRYQCYHNTHHLNNCNGQGTYVAEKVDATILEIVNEYFQRIKSTPKDKALELRYQKQLTQQKQQHKKLTEELVKKQKNLKDLSIEVAKAVSGDSKFTLDVLSMSIDSVKEQTTAIEKRLTELQTDLENKEKAFGELDYLYDKFVSWANEFETASMEQRKMITAQLIPEVRISKGYNIDAVINMQYQQFLSAV